MRRLPVGAIPLLGLLALIVFLGGKTRDKVSATPGSNGNVVLLSVGTPVIPQAALPALAGTRNVSTPAELYQVARPGDVIVIDKNLFPQVDRAFLKGALANGLPIVALNVSERDLAQATGYVDAVGARDPLMLKYMKLPAPFVGFSYSYVWLSLPGSQGVWYNGDGQKDFTSSSFAASLRSYSLMARGLTERPGGQIVPLDRPQPITPQPHPAP